MVLIIRFGRVFSVILLILLCIIVSTTVATAEDMSQGTDNQNIKRAEEKGVQEKAEKLEVPEGMVRIPAGSFEMGDNFAEGEDWELPVHKVYISEFYMDRYEVTNGKYRECVEAGVCRLPKESGSRRRDSYYDDGNYKDYPVIYVSWHDARDYCEWRGKRLPTEAEWEYAARGGLHGMRYPNGNTLDCDDANFARFASDNMCWDYGGYENDTHKVGSYPANGYGLYDMAGNVWEWCSDWFHSDYYSDSPSRNPQAISKSSRGVVVIRGGGFSNRAKFVRVSCRHKGGPSYRGDRIGIRCVK